jgi:SAM-dependent methyltransferase
LAEQDPADHHASSTGQALTDARWLDVHFESFRSEYTTSVDLVGLRPGWHVLDAGCGSGVFLPLLAERVSPDGRVAAVDLADDNVAAAQARVSEAALPCPVEVWQGSVTALPFPDAAFDAVWTANVLMYLDDDALAAALAEFRRVVRPGGLVAAKEADMRLWLLGGIAPAWYAPANAWSARTFPGVERTRSLPFYFQDAGLAGVRQQTVVVERWAPLVGFDHQFIGASLRNVAVALADEPLPDPVRAFWQAQRDPASPAAYVNQPDAAFVTAHLVVVGTVE